MIEAIRSCLWWVGLGWPPPNGGQSETTTSGHSTNTSWSSQDLYDAGIGRFDPARHATDLRVVSTPSQAWLPPFRPTPEN